MAAAITGAPTVRKTAVRIKEGSTASNAGCEPRMPGVGDHRPELIRVPIRNSMRATIWLPTIPTTAPAIAQPT
jgi:hypothetical protein